MLSIALQGCSRDAKVEPLPPPPVVVRVKDTPPAELTRCPVAPAGFPTDASAQMTPKVRAAAIRLALAYRAVVDQLGRLIDWNDPEAKCRSDPPK